MARGERKLKYLQMKHELHNNHELVNYVQHAQIDDKETCISDVPKEIVKLSHDFKKTGHDSRKATHKMDGDWTDNTASGMIEKSTKKKKKTKKKILQLEQQKEVSVKLEPIKKADTATNGEHEITKPKVFHGHFVELKPPSRLAPIKRPLPLPPMQEADATVAPKDDISTKRPLPLPPIIQSETTATPKDETNSKPNAENSKPETRVIKPEVRVVKNSDNGCHGFITTWWIRRKEKRRNKKREAIEARKSKTADSLVVSDKRATRGGVSFTVDLNAYNTDNTSGRKSVLPPIRQRNGSSRLATEKEFKNAENKRKKHITEKKDFIRVNSRLVIRTADRRAQLKHKRQEQQSQTRCDKMKNSRIKSPPPKNVYCKPVMDKDHDGNIDIVFGASSRKASPPPKMADNKSVMNEDHGDDLDIVYGANSKVMSHATKNVDSKSMEFHPKNAHCKSIWDEDYDDDFDIIYGNSSIKGSPSIKIVEHESVMDKDHDDDLDIVYGNSSIKGSPLIKITGNKEVMNKDHNDELDFVDGASSSMASPSPKKNGAFKMEFHPKNAHCKSIWDEDYDDDLDIIYGNSSIKGSSSIKIAGIKQVIDDNHDDDLDIIFGTCSKMASLSSKKADDESIYVENHGDDLDIVNGTN